MKTSVLKNQITKFVTAFILMLIILQPILVYADQGTGSIEIDVKYTNRDRADYNTMAIKVYQDFSTTPYKDISSLSANPYNIVSLPVGHKYKIELYANGMYANSAYVDLQSAHETLDITIPLPGGIRFNVFYNDGLTTIENATVLVKSQDGKQWGQSNIDKGQTTRFWIQPPIIDSNYYVVDVSIGKNLVYSFSPVKLGAGVSQEFKITTPWPAIVNSLLTVQIFKDSSKLVTTLDGNFLVELYDTNGNKIADSKVDSRGQAYFSNLKVGDYVFRAINSYTNIEWGRSTGTVDGKQNIIQIFKTQPIIQTPPITNQSTQPPNISPTSNVPNCQCVAFRLDNVQDYWLNNVQTKIMDTFQEKNASLTIGIIGNSFGNDTNLVGYIKNKIITNSPSTDIANNGWKFENFAALNKDDQYSLLKNSNDKIFSLLEITPSVFIPPFGTINNYTFDAMSENKITLLSANTLTFHTVYPSSTIQQFPATVSTGFISTGNGTSHRLTNDEIFTNIQNSLRDYGYAVVTISFQDYAMNNGTATQNEPDVQQIQQLGSLIDEIKNNGLKIVTIKEMSNKEIPNLIPSWIKNNAGWWANGQIPTSDFTKGIQYMIQKHIMVIQNLPKSGEPSGQSVPLWVKNNAGWWSQNKISDDEFVMGIEFLVQQGIIRP